MASEEIQKQIKEAIFRLETLVINQKTINEIYSKIKDIFQNEISKLPNIPVSNCKKGNQQRRKAQPFWN